MYCFDWQLENKLHIKARKRQKNSQPYRALWPKGFHFCRKGFLFDSLHCLLCPFLFLYRLFYRCLYRLCYRCLYGLYRLLLLLPPFLLLFFLLLLLLLLPILLLLLFSFLLLWAHNVLSRQALWLASSCYNAIIHAKCIIFASFFLIRSTSFTDIKRAGHPITDKASCSPYLFILFIFRLTS